MIFINTLSQSKYSVLIALLAILGVFTIGKAYRIWTDFQQRRILHEFFAHLRERHLPYSYEPLGDTQSKKIRLIELLPFRPGVDQSIPVIRIRIISLSDGEVEPYEAISYCWGDTKNLYPIFCEDGDSLFWVSRSLYQALYLLWKKKSTHHRLLWADAICINQEDLYEKGWQVRQMGDVYRKAMQVLIFLGVEQDNSQLVENFVPQLLCAKEMMDASDVRKSLAQLSTSEIRHFGIPTVYDVDSFFALAAIQQRGWFERIWVIQEFLLAKEAVLCCGSWEMSWSSFEIATRFADSLGGFCIVPWSNATFSHFERLCDSRKLYAKAQPNPLSFLLTVHRSARAKNPHDYIFALLSLAEDGDAFEINYSKSVEEVFTDAAKNMLTRSKNLALLNSTAYKRNPGPERTQLPSWVPDWRIKSSTYSLLFVGNSGATSHSDSNGTVITEEGNLRVSGYELDIVIATSCCSPDVTMTPGDMLKFNRMHLNTYIEWADFCEPFMGNVYSTTANQQLHPFWQVLIAEKTEWSSSEQKPLVGTIELQMRFMRLAQKILRPFGATAWSYLSVPLRWPLLLFVGLRNRLSSSDFQPGALDYMPKLNRNLGRRLFRTETGHFGLAPEGAEPGDVICLLKGGYTPFILRRVRPKEYILIGDCFVYGIMDGEAWRAEKCHPLWLV